MDLPGIRIIAKEHLGMHPVTWNERWLEGGAAPGDPGFRIGQLPLPLSEPEQFGKLPEELLVDRNAPTSTRPRHGPVADEFAEIEKRTQREALDL